MTIVSLTIARPAVMTEGGGFVPSAVAVAAPYAPRGPIIAGTSDTAVTLISTGAASWVLNEPSLEFHEGARMRASVIGATNIWMEGLVLSYIPDTRLLTLGVDLSSGTGATFDEWTLNVAGQPGAAGPSGPQGAPGGPTGPTGPTGMQGPPGINGATGASGPTGPSGTPGTPGGATGPTGPSGVAGAAGATGPTGASGAVGAAGGEVMVNGQLVVTAAAGALTVAVKTLAGADPSAGSPVVFRIPNASGTYDALSVTNRAVAGRAQRCSARRLHPRRGVSSVAGGVQQRRHGRARHRPHVARAERKSNHHTAGRQCGGPTGVQHQHLGRRRRISLFDRRDIEQADARARLHRMGSRRAGSNRHLDDNEHSLRAAHGTRRAPAGATMRGESKLPTPVNNPGPAARR